MSIPEKPRAVVTGAGSGLGRAFALELARRGGRVVASDIDLEAARRTAAEIGPAAEAIRCDVAKLAEVEMLATESDRLLGGVDVVVNNAGVATSGRIGEVKLADWEWLLSINLWGVIYGCHVFVPRLRAQGRGHVINVASMAGLMPLSPLGPYNVAKAGVVALSETLYSELVGTGVGVSVLCPTFVKTNIGRAARGVDARMVAFLDRMMDDAKLTAEDVARKTLDGAAAGRLHVLPHGEGRWMWRLKRFLPQQMLTLAPRLLRARARRRYGIELPE